MYKKLLSVLLSTLMLSTSSTAIITAIAEETDNLNANINTYTENDDATTQEPITITTGIITEPGDNKVGVVLRSDANRTSTEVYKFDDGTAVMVDGSKDDVTGAINIATGKVYVWYNVSYLYGGQTYTGYVREDLITVTTHTITPPNPDEEEEIVVKPFEEQLKEFPENYHPYLTALHEKYPNWIFTADNLSITYQEAIALESVFPRKLVENQYLSWRSMDKDYFNWNTGSYVVTDGRWYGASREVIAYYMDPRNFLNTNDAYIFMKQSYDEKTQSIAGLRQMLKGTFLENPYVDPNDLLYSGDYATVIMEAAKQSGVNPYILAATLIQEQGRAGSQFAHGVQFNTHEAFTVTVYNYFNFGVSGTTEKDKIYNGSKYAYEQGWTTRSAAIIGGAKKYSDGYVNQSPTKPELNQDTYFYKNYNLINPSKIYHQYAQNVADQVSTAAFLREMYEENTTTYLTFRIPVYKNNTLTEKAAVQPEKNTKQNNYYFNAIEVEGLTPSFSRYVYNYALQVEGDTTVYVNVPETATIENDMVFNLTKGDNRIVLTVKSATGYTNNYVINVNALNDCVLTLTTERPVPPPPSGDGDNGNEETPEQITSGTINEPGENKIGVNLRADASIGSNIYCKIKHGTTVTVYGTKDDVSGNANPATGKIYVWYYIKHTDGTTNYVGYIREDMIIVTTQNVTPPGSDDDDDDDDGQGGGNGGGENPDDITPPEPEKPKYLIGDTNLDGSISLSDMTNIGLHLVGSIVLTGDYLIAADTNGDGQITLSDMSNIGLHLVGSINLNQ